VPTGAAKITGQPLQRIEVHGKNLFYFFGPENGEQTVMHVRCPATNTTPACMRVSFVHAQHKPCTRAAYRSDTDRRSLWFNTCLLGHGPSALLLQPMHT